MKRLLIIAAAGVLLAACSGDDQSIEGSWLLTEGTSGVGDLEIPLNDAFPITIEFASGQVSGSGGCNQYSGTYEAEGETISFGPIAITERACLEDEVMEAESLYGITLTTVTTYDIADDELTLTGPAGTLSFTRS